MGFANNEDRVNPDEEEAVLRSGVDLNLFGFKVASLAGGFGGMIATAAAAAAAGAFASVAGVNAEDHHQVEVEGSGGGGDGDDGLGAATVPCTIPVV